MTEAILLVGGQGTRLRPLTERTAKPMLPVAGVPFLIHQLVRLRDVGVEHVVLATSYLADTFERVGTGSDLGLRIDYVVEDEPLGTGGALRNVTGCLEGAADDDVVILNGDILSGHDLRGQIDFHRNNDADVTLHLVKVDDPRAFGCVPTDDSGRVLAFLEKMPEPVSDQVNAGCYVFRRSVLDTIPPGRAVSVERETFPALLAANARVLGWIESAYWLDLGTPGAYVRGSADVVLGKVGSTALPGPAGEWIALPGADIAADAVLSGGTAVGAGATVDARAVVVASVLLDGARVGRAAHVRRSVVGAGAWVADTAVLEDAVVGDGAIVGPGVQLPPGTRVPCDSTAMADIAV